MPNIWKPTAEQCRIIREAAAREARTSRIKMEPGVRYSVEDDSMPTHMNIALVTKQPNDWTDTDLFDTRSWEDFRSGVELTDDGRAIVDFYVYSLGYSGELEGNVVVLYDAGDMKVGRRSEMRCFGVDEWAKRGKV